MSLFKKAEKQQRKLKMAISGPAGAGKTYTALMLACELGKKVAVIDTEHNSASNYADVFDFHTLPFKAPYAPPRYLKAVQAAVEEGFDVAVIDSFSHAWAGPGGLLEIVDDIKKRLKTSNSMLAWKEATPIQNAFVEGVLAAPIHVIATMRSKQAYEVSKDDKGRTSVTKLGLAPVQRDGVEYEFDIVLDIDRHHTAVVEKTRCLALADAVIRKPDKQLAETLKKWLGV